MRPSRFLSIAGSRRARAGLRRAVDVAAIVLAFAVVIALAMPASRTDVAADASVPVAARLPL